MKKTIYALLVILASLPAFLSGQSTSVSTRPGGGADLSEANLAECKAAFSFAPDSLTSSPFNYYFKDLSTGNINSWYWDFGDGSLSNDQNPMHQYEGPGTYTVCLYAADENDTASCSDYVCKQITTVDYYSLGGLVYAGDYPLNNPVMAGDTGVASLYRVTNGQILYVEDNIFVEYGYYWFGYLIPGQYLVKVSLTEGSPHYNNYFTTYYGDEVSWLKSDIMNIDESQFEAEIHLRSVTLMNAGTGIIKGYVNFEEGNFSSMPPISQTTVILSDKNHNPLIFTRPDASGYFQFNGISFDSYFLNADATGKSASAVSVTLSTNTPLIDGINLTIFGSSSNYIPEGDKDGIYMARIFPNPVIDNLHLRFYSGISAPVSLRIIDVTGKSYFNQAPEFESGMNDVLIPVSMLPNGIYLIILQTEGNYLPVTAKFIK